jgi:hypothetical protein
MFFSFILLRSDSIRPAKTGQVTGRQTGGIITYTNNTLFIHQYYRFLVMKISAIAVTAGQHPPVFTAQA